MAERTNGRISVVKQNAAGYYAFKIGEVWYNAGKSFPFEKGDVVEFDFYLKDDKWKTLKGEARKIEVAPAASSKAAPGGRDDYWAKKEQRDTEATPRIIYMASYERAVQFATLALANGAISLEKVKPADKLDVIQKFVDEQALRIASASLAARMADTPPVPAPEPQKKEEEEDPEKWS
jgi:hypothetical protein